MESLGEKIREERRKRKLTLELLSQKTGLSKSFLSQIERGLAQPSVSSLKKIAQEFGLSVVSLFANEANSRNLINLVPSFEPRKQDSPKYVQDVKVVRRNRRKTLTLPGSKISYELVTPDLNRQMEVLFLRFTPGDSSGEEPLLDPPGEKCCLVLKGALDYRAGEEVYHLEAGDSIYHPANIPHSWQGTGNEPIEVIVILTPPWF